MIPSTNSHYKWFYGFWLVDSYRQYLKKKQVNKRHLKYLINFVDIGPNFFYLFAFSLFFYNDTSFIFFSPHMAMSLDFQGI